MLFGADKKELFPLKMRDGAGIEKAPLSQYVRRCWHEKDVSTEIAMRSCYKKSSSNSNTKDLYPRKMLRGAGIEKTSLTQYVKQGWHKKAQFTKNARRGWYKKLL